MARFEVRPAALVAMATAGGAFLVVAHGGVTETDDPLLTAGTSLYHKLLATGLLADGLVADKLADFVTVPVH